MSNINIDRELFGKYYKALCYYAWDMVKDTDVAEDLVQDAFTAYWNHRDDVANEEQSIKAFLYSSIRNAVFNRNRHQKVVDKYFSRLGLTELEEADYDRKIITAEFYAELNRILSTLPAGCRQVFHLSYMEELSNQQVADELHISINTVKTQKQRALKVIRQNLNPEFMVLFLTLYFC